MHKKHSSTRKTYQHQHRDVVGNAEVPLFSEDSVKMPLKHRKKIVNKEEFLGRNRKFELLQTPGNGIVANAKETNEDVICPDGVSKCPAQMTCCPLNNDNDNSIKELHAWGCCPTEKAVCCADKMHCCPHNTRCATDEGRCVNAVGFSRKKRINLKLILVWRFSTLAQKVSFGNNGPQ